MKIELFIAVYLLHLTMSITIFLCVFRVNSTSFAYHKKEKRPCRVAYLILPFLFSNTQLNALELADTNVFAVLGNLFFDTLLDCFAVVQHKCLLGQNLFSEVLLELAFDDFIRHLCWLAF